MWRHARGLEAVVLDADAKVTPSVLAGHPAVRRVPADSAGAGRVALLVVDEHSRERARSSAKATPADASYIIARGTVEVLVQRDGDEHGHQVAVLHDGDFFGEVALVSDAARNATVRTLTDCRLLSLHRTLFLALLEREPDQRAGSWPPPASGWAQGPRWKAPEPRQQKRPLQPERSFARFQNGNRDWPVSRLVSWRRSGAARGAGASPPAPAVVGAAWAGRFRTSGAGGAAAAGAGAALGITIGAAWAGASGAGASTPEAAALLAGRTRVTVVPLDAGLDARAGLCLVDRSGRPGGDRGGNPAAGWARCSVRPGRAWRLPPSWCRSLSWWSIRASVQRRPCRAVAWRTTRPPPSH